MTHKFNEMKTASTINVEKIKKQVLLIIQKIILDTYGT